MSRKRAFTLTELIVVATLGVLVLGVTLRLYFNFRREAERPQASMSMEETTITVVRWLQHDLAETNLQSILSLPNEAGVVMESPRDLNDVLQFNPTTGLVAWQKFLYYEVKENLNPSVPLPSSVMKGSVRVTPGLGRLTCNEAPAGPPLPIEPGQPPSSPAFDSRRSRVLAHNLLIDKGAPALGLAVYFMDPISNTPRQFTARDRGEPVCVALYMLDISGRTGQATTRTLHLQVKPKN